MAMTREELLAKTRQHYEKKIGEATDKLAAQHKALSDLQNERDFALAAVDRYFDAQNRKTQADIDLVTDQSEIDRITNLP